MRNHVFSQLIQTFEKMDHKTLYKAHNGKIKKIIILCNVAMIKNEQVFSNPFNVYC